VLTFPRGKISGNAIHFDVILLGQAEDAQRVRDDIRNNLELLASCATRIKSQVNDYKRLIARAGEGGFCREAQGADATIFRLR
jgi:hypothetical protein